MNKDNINISSYISLITNILTIISIIVGYFTKQYIIYIIIILTNFLCNIYLLIQNNRLKTKYNHLKAENEDLYKKNNKLQRILLSLSDNVFIGQMPIHTLIQYLPLKRKESNIKTYKYFNIKADIYIVYDEKKEDQTMLDVDYTWTYSARNISDKPLKYLTFRIAGDNIIRDNNKLQLRAILNKNSEKQREVVCNVIEDNFRTKLVQVDFGDFAVQADMDFNLKLIYKWEKSYSISGDMFSFDPTNHPEAICESMQLNIRTHRKVMNSAMILMKKIDGIEIQNEEIFENIDIIPLENKECLIHHILDKNACNTQMCFIKILP